MTFAKILDKKSPYLFFIKFLGCFFCLYFFFMFYWGVTGKGGTIYLQFLDEHFNIIRWLTGFLAGTSRFFLEAFHYSVYQKDYHSLQIESAGGINVNPSCLGWGVMSFWVAFVFANRGSWKHKLKWMIIGIASICMLNIVRITLITIAIYRRWATLTSLDHHQTFNIFSYGCIFILMNLYIRIQKKYEVIDFEQKGRVKQTSAM